MQRIDKSCRADHSCSVLIIMENRYVHNLFQGLLDDETLGCLDVFEVDAAKGWAHELHGIDKFFWVFGVQLDIDGVHICKALK